MANQDWVREVTAGASLRAIGEKLGINHVTVGRRIDEGKADTCIDIARAYGANPIAGLIEWGLLTTGEVAEDSVALAIREATDLQLAEELVRRIKGGQSTVDVNSPIDTVVEVTPKELRPDNEVRRWPRGAAPDFSLPHAASHREKQVYPEAPDDGR